MQGATSRGIKYYKHCRLANEGLVKLEDAEFASHKTQFASTNTPDVSHYSTSPPLQTFLDPTPGA